MQTASVRVTSIAKRIGRAWTARLLGIFLLMDLLIVALFSGWFLYHAEKGALEGQWRLQIQRDFELTIPLSGGSYYRFCLADGEWMEADIAGFLRSIAPFIAALCVIQFLLLLLQASWGVRKARKLLKPLNVMAEIAQQLVRQQSKPEKRLKTQDSEEKLQGLEEAIGRITPGEQLRTGDTELQGLEKAINDMLSRMQEAYRQQTRFVSDASHELRTPVAVIQGYASMLQRWGKNDPKVLGESIDAIANESEYMKKLIDQLLFLARGDSGRNRLEMTKVSLGEMAREIRAEGEMIDTNHVWEIGRCDPALVRGDAAMLKQCLRVLAENASRYTPQGGSIRLSAREADKGKCCVSVQDTGCGIKQEEIEHIFDRFYRADEARSREMGGTGLGLAIAKWIVDNHEGRFEVLSQPGIGTRFTVCLPAWEEPSPDTTLSA